MLAKAWLYAETMRHLRPVQIYGRLLNRLKRVETRLPSCPPVRARRGPWIEPIRPPATLIGPDTVHLLGETGRIENGADWTPTDKSPLWRYTLHYFEDLVAEGAADRRAWQARLIGRWLAHNPPRREPAWAPYPLSLRIANWVTAALDGFVLPDAAIDSLARQAHVLDQTIEYHLQGNHLLANARGLIFAGLFFDGPVAEHWLDRGQALFETEWRKQLLADGGHFERSPMYHALLLDDLLDIVNAMRAYRRPVPPDWETQAEAMLDWLAAMTHPDGAIALFNDAALDSAPTLGALSAYAVRLGLSPPATPLPSRDLAHSGYVRVNFPTYTAFLDAAPVGPDYIPGHAHADTLGFELSVGGRRVLVDGGTSTYWDPEHRARERGTAAHNTVTVDGENSSEVWAQFRVARRARIVRREITLNPDKAIVRAAHDGYARLSDPVIHERVWTGTPQAMQITDRLDGEAPHDLALRFYLAPGLTAEAVEGGFAVGAEGRMLIRIETDAQLDWTLEPAIVACRFGIRQQTQVLVGRCSGALTAAFETRLLIADC